MNPSPPLLNVENLRVHFATRAGPVRAVAGITLSIRAGETVALVGESGCGKSVTALALARLVAPSGCVISGRIVFDGKEVLAMNPAHLRRLRGAEISYIFQEPSTSLNPVFRVGYQVAEAIRLHRAATNARAEAVRLLQLVGLPDPEHRYRTYPHELSGGMQQRIMIAMALACRPKLLIADEPTTALDVTIQAQILDLLANLQTELGMAVLLITHNLGLVADMAHRIFVMYAGRIVESGPAAELLTHPAHYYTRGLLAAVPSLEGATGRLAGIPGLVPNPARFPSGCKFHPRCPRAEPLCRREEPEISVVNGEHNVRCHFSK